MIGIIVYILLCGISFDDVNGFSNSPDRSISCLNGCLIWMDYDL